MPYGVKILYKYCLYFGVLKKNWIYKTEQNEVVKLIN